MKTPCLRCNFRHINCHSTCKLYKEFFKANEKRKEDMLKKSEFQHYLHKAEIRRKKGAIRL